MSKHAPGPWKWNDGYRGLEGNDRTVIHYFDYEGMWLPFTSERDANAFLIAAAPDLLEALKEALPWIGGIANENGSAEDAYQAAVIAIAKAEGK